MIIDTDSILIACCLCCAITVLCYHCLLVLIQFSHFDMLWVGYWESTKGDTYKGGFRWGVRHGVGLWKSHTGVGPLYSLASHQLLYIFCAAVTLLSISLFLLSILSCLFAILLSSSSYSLLCSHSVDLLLSIYCRHQL